MKVAHWTSSSRFEGSFELYRLCFGNSQVCASERRPLFRRSWVRLQHVGYREPRPQRCAIAAVKFKQFLGQRLVQPLDYLAHNAFPYPGSAKSFAFEAEIGNFVERIDRTQLRAELETIDDLRWLAEPDVLRSQIAVPVHDALCSHALGEQFATLFKKQALRTINAPNQSASQLELWIEQNLVILGDVSLPVAQIQSRRKERASCRTVEPHHKARHAVNLCALDTTGCDGVVQQPHVVQPLHHDEPIDNGPRSSD